MAKGYYESEGSDYLNRSPSVSKQGQNSVPAHDHDERYFTKEESENREQNYEEKFQGINEQISTIGEILDDKAPINHFHANATTIVDGFMSASDKRKVDALGKTHISLASTYTTPLPPNTDVKLIYDIHTFNDNGEYDRITDTITMKSTGMYLINAMVETEGHTANNRVILQVFKNGVLDTVIGIGHHFSGTPGGVGGSTLLYLEDGDKIAFYAKSLLQATTRGKEYVKIVRIW